MFEAKNNFFEALEENPQIDSVTIGELPIEPIPREEFALRVTPVKPKDEVSWEFQVRRFFVTSPNWDKDDRQRGWKGRDKKGLTVFFTIYDPGFWIRFENKEIKSETIDELVVQVAVKRINGKRKGQFVLKVLSYNDQSFGADLNPIELERLLHESGLGESHDRQSDLFESE